MTSATILWRRLDEPGHEAARLSALGSSWHLDGTAVFAHDGQPCRLDYLVICDSRWRAVSAHLLGWIGSEVIKIEVSVDPARRWRLQGAERPEVDGCIDVDLNFSPSTNLLPIRRLNLGIGQEAQVRAALAALPGVHARAATTALPSPRPRNLSLRERGGTVCRRPPGEGRGFRREVSGLLASRGHSVVYAVAQHEARRNGRA